MSASVPRDGSPCTFMGEAQQYRETDSGSADTISVQRISHVGDTFRVCFMQNETNCPIIRVFDGVTSYPINFVLLKEGPFSIRLDSPSKDPVVVKLEVNGKMCSNEYRILPKGTRTIREVRERLIATTKALSYHFPVMYDNLLCRDVGLREIQLLTLEDANEFTSLCRVLFLPVRGGIEATRCGKWAIDASGRPLAVEMFRLGHHVPLARFFDDAPRPPSPPVTGRPRSPSPQKAGRPRAASPPMTRSTIRMGEVNAVGPRALQEKSLATFRSQYRSTRRSTGPPSHMQGSPSASCATRPCSPKSRQICPQCNAVFNRERRMYNDMINALRGRLNALEHVEEQMQSRGDSLHALMEIARQIRRAQENKANPPDGSNQNGIT